jgi:DNA-binding XRE family transcriptional regulator
LATVLGILACPVALSLYLKKVIIPNGIICKYFLGIKRAFLTFFILKGIIYSRKEGRAMSLGKEIKKARIDKGWQQKDLQEATGLSQKYLSQVELDKVDPRFSVVKRIARALGVSLDTLAKEDEEATAPQPTRQRTRKATPTA